MWSSDDSDDADRSYEDAYSQLESMGIVPSMTGRASRRDDDNCPSDIDVNGRTPSDTSDDSVPTELSHSQNCEEPWLTVLQPSEYDNRDALARIMSTHEGSRAAEVSEEGVKAAEAFEEGARSAEASSDEGSQCEDTRVTEALA